MEKAESNKKEAYSSEYQPKKDKLAISLLVALFCSFNLMIFAPFDFYIANRNSLYIPIANMLYSFIPAALILFVAVGIICFSAQKKLHIAVTSLFFGISLAMYIQGNFLSSGLGELDGTIYEPGAVKIIVNMIIWVAVISVPFLIYKFNRPFFKYFIKFGSALIVAVEVITLTAMVIYLLIMTNILQSRLASTDKYLCTDQDLYTYSSDKNYIIILTDEYDSFCFDAAVEADPDCISGFDGFTYYPDTLGMYSSTIPAVQFMMTGTYNEDISKEIPDYSNDTLLRTIQENYKMDIYGGSSMFPQDIYLTYADNYIQESYTYRDYIWTFATISKVTMFRYMPEALKNLFWIYSSELSDGYSFGEHKSYSYYDLDFYDRLEDTLDITDESCFKFIYLFGLHDPRNVTADLQKAEDWSVSGDEQAIAVNKILSEYFEILKANGVYDNSEIILLADHGIKSHDRGKYPLLLIKRAGDTSEGITVNNAPISHEELYPTLLYLAGYDSGEKTVFDVDENEERERYFAGTDEYITGKIK